MKKQILKNSRRLKKSRTYTAGELVLKLGIHRQTLRTWRKEGLAPDCAEKQPWLYLGQTVKNFIQARQQKRKGHCQPDECWCFRCKRPRRPKGRVLNVIKVGKPLRSGRVAAQLGGQCEVCGCEMRRRGSISVEEAGGLCQRQNGS